MTFVGLDCHPPLLYPLLPWLKFLALTPSALDRCIAPSSASACASRGSSQQLWVAALWDWASRFF